jgi:hypothetical protein
MKQYLIFLAIVSSLASCKKKLLYPDDLTTKFTLPPVTQSGQNTFGFVIDSIVWVNYGQDVENPELPNLKATYLSGDSSVNLIVNRILMNNGAIASNQSFSFTLINDIFETPGNYFIGSKTYGNSNSVGFFNNDIMSQKIYGVISSRPTFLISVSKFDTVNHIFSGQFSGTLFNVSNGSYYPNLNDSIVITQGRFDTKLQ